MYDEIKKNIIERFLNTHYLWTCCNSRIYLINDMRERIPFDIKYTYDNENQLEIDLGNNINIVFNLVWEIRTHKNSQGKDIESYRLISIN